ncbi:hypothetical protein BD779DRAFT_1220260 [Infundibulicybe gibba]|nr:hypothetical protein BD779DRAFT_1220260 [Infundibulicybe gibba]
MEIPIDAATLVGATEDQFLTKVAELRNRIDGIEAAFEDRSKSMRLEIEAAHEDRLKAVEEALARHTWTLAKIQMGGLLEHFEAMALWRLEIPGAEQTYSESAASRAWRLWVGSLPKGSAREELIKTIEARIEAADGEMADLEILLKEEAALDVLLNGSRSGVRIDRILALTAMLCPMRTITELSRFTTA